MDLKSGSFPKIRGTFFGGPHSKDNMYFGVYVGVPLFRETTKYACSFESRLSSLQGQGLSYSPP